MAALPAAIPADMRPASSDFRLLVLGDRAVRWQLPETRLPVSVTYAFLDRPASFEGARNCSRMLPAEAALRPSGIATSRFRSEVRAAFDMWSAAANIAFTEMADGRQADILIGADAVPRGRAFTNVAPRGEAATGIGRIARSLICLNPRQRWKIGFDGNLDVYDLRYTLAHEIGHAIGLDHPSPEGQLMSFRYREHERALQPGDIAGAVALYGPRAGSPSGHLPRRTPAPPAGTSSDLGLGGSVRR